MGVKYQVVLSLPVTCAASACIDPAFTRSELSHFIMVVFSRDPTENIIDA